MLLRQAIVLEFVDVRLSAHVTVNLENIISVIRRGKIVLWNRIEAEGYLKGLFCLSFGPFGVIHSNQCYLLRIS